MEPLPRKKLALDRQVASMVMDSSLGGISYASIYENSDEAQKLVKETCAEAQDKRRKARDSGAVIQTSRRKGHSYWHQVINLLDRTPP